MKRKSMKIKYDSDHINNNMFFERKYIKIKYGSGLNNNIFLVLLIEQVWIFICLSADNVYPSINTFTFFVFSTCPFDKYALHT